MNITEWHLVITHQHGTKSLTYRGNENIIIRSSEVSVLDDEGGGTILFPRQVLEKFMEMIEG